MFWQGGGEMGELTRGHDWHKTSLGDPEYWPQSLKTTLSILLNSRFPMFLWWGPELLCFYNDAYRPSLGENAKHPHILGMPAKEAWPEIWDTIKPLIDGVLKTGEATFYENLLLPIFRNNKMEEVYWTFSYSPVTNELGEREAVLVTCMETTLQVQLISNLQESERRFKILVDDVGVGITVLTGDDLVISVVNARFAQLVHRTVDQLAGHPIFNVIPEAAPDFKPIIAKVLRDQQAIYLFEKEYGVLSEGETVTGYLNLVYQPFSNETETGVMIICQDVTQQILSRRQVEQALEQLTLSKEAAQLGTFDLDLVNNTMLWDERCRQLFGITDFHELDYSNDFAAGLHPEDKDRILSLIDHLYKTPSTNGVYDVEYRTIGAADGRLRWVRAKGRVYYDAHDTAVRFIGSVLDITEQKDDDQRKSDFISMVSHELKTPLTLIKGYNQLLKEDVETATHPTAMSFLMQTEKQINKMIGLTESFLNVSMLESGKISLNKTLFDMDDLIKQVHSESLASGQTHNIHCATKEGSIVEADFNKISQVLHNFISNAVKYSKPGSAILIDCEQLDKQVKVTVKDTGMGINKQDVPFVFERFYRVQNPQINAISGFGIGLYLSQEIIERHNGKIGVESVPDEGSSFWFSIPLAEK